MTGAAEARPGCGISVIRGRSARGNDEVDDLPAAQRRHENREGCEDMTDREPESGAQGGGQTRRTFLERAAAGAATVGGSAALSRSALAATRAGSAPRGGMNILVVMVDQMRMPSMWLPGGLRRRALPNITRLADRSVQFVNHITASNACSPARSTILTGLYTHQNAMYITQELQEGGALGGNSPDLNPGFPTYGTMLRSIGYKTSWIGKWHLSSKCDYEPYGFATYVCPSPNGGPSPLIPTTRTSAPAGASAPIAPDAAPRWPSCAARTTTSGARSPRATGCTSCACSPPTAVAARRSRCSGTTGRGSGSRASRSAGLLG